MSLFLSSVALGYSWDGLSRGDKIPGEYVVSLHNTALLEDHVSAAEAAGMKILHRYKIDDHFQGFAYAAPDGASNGAIAQASTFAKALNASKEVKIVEENAVVTADMSFAPKAECVSQQEAVWGLVRTSQKALKIDGLFHYAESAAGSERTFAYVMDSGIYRENVEFEDRAIWGFDAVDNPSPKTDLNGHGTHCAGTIMAKNYGLAKKAVAVDVRVLGATGSGSYAGVIAGIDFTANDGKGKKAVGSMSLGGGFSQAVNDAVDAAVASGVTMVLSAGNDGADSCSQSPASAGGAAGTAITVMSSDNQDFFAWFSNWGTCSDIIAPGVSVTSAWIGSPYSINTISGTSMSAPHVAGVAVMTLSKAGHRIEPAALKKQILDNASDDQIYFVPRGPTPNKLLHKGCDE
jgi:subtilisin family serine protease